MDNINDFLQQVPSELTVVLGGFIVSILTQLSKKIRDKFKYDIDPKVLAAFFAILIGVLYAFVIKVTPAQLMEKIVEFWALAFSGAIAIYELYKSLIKKPIEVENQFNKNINSLNTSPILEDLIETERKARMLNIDFEEFSLESIKSGRLTNTDLSTHVFSLNERIKKELSQKGSSFLSETGI